MDLTFSTFSLYLALTSSGEMFFITPTTGRIYCVLPVSVREEVRGHGQTPVRRAVPDKRCFVLATSDADFKRFLRAAELELLSTSARARTVNILGDHLLLDSLSEVGEVFGACKPDNIDEPVVLADIDDLVELFF
jgi:hypothetical protein